MEYDCLVIDDEKMLADSTVEYFNLSGVKAAAVYDALSCQKFLKENTARTSDDDKLVAFHIGGDDYVEKPYSLSVLLAKVKVMLKRFGQGTGVKYSDSWLTVDFDSRQVLAGGNPAKLTAQEFKLLSYLIKNENRVIPKRELFEKVWEDKFTGDGTLNVHIRKIREAVERDPGKPEYIVTVWGDGYKFSGGR